MVRPLHLLLALLWAAPGLVLWGQSARAVDANTCGYTQGNGGWYSKTDRSGPYSLDGNCTATLIGTGATGGGGGGATGSVTSAGTNGTVAQAVQGINGGVPVPVTGSFSSSALTGSQELDVTASRTLDATSTSSQQTYTLNGQSTFSFTFSGLTASGATVSFFQSNDWNGTTGTFTAVSEVNTGTGVASLTRSTDGQSAIGVEGSKAVRVQVSTAGTGTITLASNISVRSRYLAVRSPLPPGTNPMGYVGVGQYNASLPTLTNAQYAYVAVDVNGRQILAPSSSVSVSNLPATQTVAGTVTANLGTLNGAALDTSVQQVKTALGSPFQAGASIGNTAFGISGTLPGYASTPTFNIGTLGGAATAANQTAVTGSAAGGTAAASSQLSGGVYNSTAPTLTSGQQAALQFDVNGQLKVTGAGGGGGAAGSVTAAGTNGTTAQAVQGINGGVPLPITGSISNTAFGISGTLPAFAAIPTFTINQGTPGTTNKVSIGTDGTVAATQSGAWNVTNITGTVSLPTGAATAANQTAVTGSAAGGTAATSSTLTGGVYNTTAPTLTAGQQAAVQSDVNGRLLINNATLPPGASTAAAQPSVQTAGSAATGTGLRTMANDGSAMRDVLVTTTGALEPPTAASGKITKTSTALTANTSTTIAAANTARIAMGIQCAGAAAVAVDETGAALTAATIGNGTIIIPAGSTPPYFAPPVTTRTAVTAYTGTAQTCVVTEYLR